VRSLEERYEAGFFTQREVNVWNVLPEVVVGVGTIVTFKEHLDRYMSKMGIGGTGKVLV